jgi:glycosyltransferase involved in cell wall biosynthesis
MKKVSFICTTYRRFYCVRRILSQFFAQTYPNKELIIFNTDEEYPYVLGIDDDPNVIIINNSKDYLTGEPYKNRGQICRDAVTHATGDYFMLADDDDIYLPWHLKQAVEGIESNGKDAWKPEMSFFATQSEIKIVKNTLEASVIVKMNRIREIGFRSDLTGYEGLSWYTKLRDENNLDEHNKEYLPSYCFNWGDPSEVAGHKQSGDIDNPDNFENHKKASGDYASAPLTPIFNSELEKVYQKYYDYIGNNLATFNIEFYNKYFPKMNKIQEILVSYATSFNPTPEQKEVAEKRLAICMACDKWVQGTIRDYCSVCGCTTSAKVFSPKGADACPESKWLE